MSRNSTSASVNARRMSPMVVQSRSGKYEKKRIAFTTGDRHTALKEAGPQFALYNCSASSRSDGL